MRRQSFAVLALVPALALGLGACGNGKNGATGSATAKAASDADKMRQYAKCMRDNGINMPDPEVDANGNIRMKMNGPAKGGPPPADMDAKMKAAEDKCKHLQPNGGKPKKLNAQELAQMRNMAKCMREHGVNMPDPDPNGGGIKMTKRGSAGGGPQTNSDGGGDVDPESSTFKAAQKACAKYDPKGGGGVSTSRSGG
ncbi:hypothetical protein J4573_46455 [Actinomadura barringtoniae]|uniref:Secreted protein n=1 Tax=Actinomadura barringtoniae TaxID=1427535 RepID=A0A939T9S8_9ACTN|nr:hypothetical protein [Actinomadura barringtoniae]MBO2454599.1 hypothetical protein [Actinomadura barringtoniae]